METLSADLVVVGGGFSGVCAAVAAARHGLNTILIHNRAVPGGNSSSESGIGINGASSLGHSPSVYAREGGICEEVKLGMSYYKSRDLGFYEVLYREKKLQSFFNTHVTDVIAADGKIKAVKAVQLFSERKFLFEAEMFIDSTGDGTVGCMAGAEYMYGREARDKFNESLAPEKADEYTLGSSILFESIDTGKPAPFKKPEFAYDIIKMPFFENIGKEGLERYLYRGQNEFEGFWWVEYGGQVDTIKDSEDITLELRKIVYGIWDYIKNSGKFENVENQILGRVMPFAAKRESRRFIGDYVFNQNDVDEKRSFPDAVATAGWEMDVHAPKGIYDNEPATIWHYVAGVLNLPFAMMYSRNIPNLMFAGRNASSTHIAFGTTRLACTGAVMGQAVGTAAYLCNKYGITPRDVRNDRIDELRALLNDDDQFMVGYKTDYSSELYKGLSIVASSEKVFENSDRKGLLKLDKPMGLALPVEEYLSSFEIGVQNTGSDRVLEVSVYTGERKENYIPSTLLKKVQIDIPGGFDGWKRLLVDCKSGEDKKLYFVFDKADDLAIYGTNTVLTGAVSFHLRSIKLHTKVKYAGLAAISRLALSNNCECSEICFKGVEPKQGVYSAVNLINGYSRPYGMPNIWISDNKDKDCNVTLSFDSDRTIERLQLVFSTRLEEDEIYKTQFPNSVIKSFTVEVKTADGNDYNYDVSDNYKRICNVNINKNNVREIKIIFRENYGSEYYEMYAIKLF